MEWYTERPDTSYSNITNIYSENIASVKKIQSYEINGASNQLFDPYSDVIMSTMASQITGVSIVYSTVCWQIKGDTDQRRHQSSASPAFVRGIHRSSVNSPHKGPVVRKMLPFDDVIMEYLNSRLRLHFHHWLHNEIQGLKPTPF